MSVDGPLPEQKACKQTTDKAAVTRKERAILICPCTTSTDKLGKRKEELTSSKFFFSSHSITFKRSVKARRRRRRPEPEEFELDDPECELTLLHGSFRVPPITEFLILLPPTTPLSFFPLPRHLDFACVDVHVGKA